MKVLLVLTLLSLIFLLTGCSSLNPGEKIVASMDNESRPKWARQSEIIESKDGKIRFLGFEEVDGQARISSALELSDYRTVGEVSTFLTTKFNKVFQRLEEGLQGNGLVTREVGMRVSKSVIKNLRLVGRYWEKVVIVDPDGNRDLRLRVYSLGEIKETDLRSLIDQELGTAIPEAIREEAKNAFVEEISNF